MNFKIVRDTYECPEGFAVVSVDGKFDSCHFTKDRALSRIEMIYKLRGNVESN